MFGKISKYVTRHKIEIVILVSILLIAAFFRLYRISDYMTFLGDEGRDAIVAKDILRGDFTLLGPRASAGDFFLGPIYYYMMAPFLLLSGYDPVGPAIMVALFGVATVYLIYHVGRNFFGYKTGLFAASLYAVSPVVVAYSRSSWNPNPMPFFALLILYLSYQAVNAQRLINFLIVGLLLGVAIQLHYLTIFLGLIVLIFILVGNIIKSKKNILSRSAGQILTLAAGFFVIISPFLLFEIRHSFPNTQTILGFIFKDNTSEPYAIGQSFLINIADVSFRLFGRLVTKFPSSEQLKIMDGANIPIWLGGSIILAIFAVVALFATKDKLKVLLLTLWFFLGVLFFGFYKKPIYDYYLGFMFPLPFLLVGNLFSLPFGFKKYTRILIFLTLILFAGLFVLNLSGAPFRFPPNKQKDQAKTIAEFVLEKTEGKPFNFALLTDGNSDHVYRYFFEVANRAPVTILNTNIDPQRKSVTDQLLIVCEKPECSVLGNSLWEVAGFGRAEIEGVWDVPHVKVYKLKHYIEQ